MGPRDTPPPLPTFEVLTCPPERVTEANIMMEEANWLQNMEGDMDTVHLDWVHGKLSKDAPYAGVGISGFWNEDAEPPRLDVQAAPYGAYYTAKRTINDGADEWHRINQFLFPFHTMISSGHHAVLRSFIPVDDEHAMLMSQSAAPGDGPMPASIADRMDASDPYKDWGGYAERTNDPRSYFYTKANRHNDYMMDPEIAEKSLNIGIPFIANLQDRAMTELMCGPDGEPLYDRTQEHLGTSDAMIIMMRSQLLQAVKHMEKTGEAPPNVDDVSLDRVRCATVVLPAGSDWVKDSEMARNADSGDGISFDHHLVPEID